VNFIINVYLSISFRWVWWLLCQKAVLARPRGTRSPAEFSSSESWRLWRRVSRDW